MNSIYDEFNLCMSKIETISPTLLDRFSRHPYLGHAHFNSIYDAGSTITSYRKIEMGDGEFDPSRTTSISRSKGERFL